MHELYLKKNGSKKNGQARAWFSQTRGGCFSFFFGSRLPKKTNATRATKRKLEPIQNQFSHTPSENAVNSTRSRLLIGR
jgi:hypothetical protein